jgi:hypothetical protein
VVELGARGWCAWSEEKPRWLCGCVVAEVGCHFIGLRGDARCQGHVAVGRR